jgi:hypothetical protein
MKWQEAGENCIMKNFITWTVPNICRMSKTGRVSSEGHVAHTDVKGNACRILVKRPDRGHPEDIDLVGV